MVDFLKNWAINIVIVAIFITFLEIILPSGNMKKYIKMIVGLLIIYVLINPFIKLASKDINIEREVFANINNMNNIRFQEEGQIKDLQTKQIVDIYLSKLEREIKDIITSNVNYSVIQIELEIIEDRESENFGLINKVNIGLMEEDESNNNSDIKDNNEIKVENVKEVSININNESEQLEGTEFEDSTKIQSLLSDYYKIPKENINVYLIS